MKWNEGEIMSEFAGNAAGLGESTESTIQTERASRFHVRAVADHGRFDKAKKRVRTAKLHLPVSYSGKTFASIEWQ